MTKFVLWFCWDSSSFVHLCGKALRTDFGSTFPAPGISLPCGKLSEKRERAFLTNREPGRSFSSTYPVFWVFSTNAKYSFTAEIIIISYHMTCFLWVWGSTLVHCEKKLRFTNVLAPWTLTLKVRHPPRVKTRVSKEDRKTHRSKIKTFLDTAAPFIDFCLSRFVSRG